MVMKYLSVLLLSVILLTSCDAPNCSCEFDENGEPPKLKVTNTTSCGHLHTVSLVGYQFESLYINKDESKTFTLTDGIPAGLEDVNVYVLGSNSSGTKGLGDNITVDFVAGQTTSIKMVLPSTATFCDYAEIYLELDE